MEKLRHILSQEDTVLFIGSGISMWSGLPSWSELIDQLAQYMEAAGVDAALVRSEAMRGDLLQAASYGFAKLTKHQIGEFVKTASMYGRAKPHEIHKKIVNLGPNCYVTTNYDNLIEESLRKWHPDSFYRMPVTNRQFTEIAEIIHARASNFVFKPHGDAGDCESIILTREQYRQLLPAGYLHSAMQSLMTLMVTRPVVYLGFGLRDPDFIYVRDILANTYKGGVRDHYAVMADVKEAENDYWRDNYGIHLVNYNTSMHPGEKHSQLISLLDILLESNYVPCAPDIVLSLARYAAGLANLPKLENEFVIRVRSESTWNMARKDQHFYKYNHYPVNKFLRDGPDRTVFIGLPGAGKTYSLKQAVARIAKELHESCLSGNFDEKSVVIPIIVDLKTYNGSLLKLVNQTLPLNVPLEEAIRRFQVKIYLDSYNEMPRKFQEEGVFESDFIEIEEMIGNSRLLIASRTTDGLTKLGYPTYRLDRIDINDVERELERLGHKGDGRFDQEIKELLQKPFFFQYIARGKASVPSVAHPRDIYSSIFSNMNKAFAAQFHMNFPFELTLSNVAYDAIDAGLEVFPLNRMLAAVEKEIHEIECTDLNAEEIVNWLISYELLIPYVNKRIAFVHQSITEYLAAFQLARKYVVDPFDMKDKLSLLRWDQALFLAISFLPQETAETLFQEISNADFELALTAVKYLEHDRDKYVLSLLGEVPKWHKMHGTTYNRITWILQSGLPLSIIHEHKIREIMLLRDSLGGVAAGRLIQLKGESVKHEMLRELFNARDDYNYCVNGIAHELKSMIVKEDVPILIEMADSLSGEMKDNSHEDHLPGFVYGVATLLSNIDVTFVFEQIVSGCNKKNLPEIRARIICEVLEHGKSSAALELAGDLLLWGVRRAAVAIYFIASSPYCDRNIEYDKYDERHVEALVMGAQDPSENSWSLKALKVLCKRSEYLAGEVRKRAESCSGMLKAVLSHCVSSVDTTLLFSELRNLVDMSVSELENANIWLLEKIDINWSGNEDLFLQLIRLNNPVLTSALLEHVYLGGEFTLENTDIGPIEWWLDMFNSNCFSGDRFWMKHRLSWLLMSNVSSDVKQQFVDEFNKESTKYRQLLADTILPRHYDLSTDDLSVHAVSYLLEDLETRKIGYDGHLLCDAASEEFVELRILPLLRNAEEPLLSNLHQVLREAGINHKRRYKLDNE